MRIQLNYSKIWLTIVFSQFMLSGTSQDVFTRGLVYQSPEMKKVAIKEKIQFASINDTSLTFDIYYPPAFNSRKKLPLVIFNNGVGSMDIPRWGIYKDWARLVAANGMIAVNYQGRPGKGLADGEVFIDYLVKHAAELSIDNEKIGMWTCSANARTGLRLAYKSRPAIIKALVQYYGGPDSLGQLRQDLPLLLVRAGLDAQFLNTNIDEFVQAALQQDAQIELVNYIRGIHAFDAFQNTDESKEIIVRTISFLKKNLTQPQSQHDFVLTNKNFMWLIMNNKLGVAVDEFRKARATYRADPNFQPFYNAVIREDVLNANGYWLLNRQRKTDALEVFKLAVETYPESPNAYESLSEAFEAMGNKEEAIKHAETCLLKLPAATGLNDNFRQVIKRGAEDRLQRLKGANEGVASSGPPKRAHHGLVYDESAGRIIMTSGSTPVQGGNAGIFFNDIWSFDGKTWKAIGVAGDKRSGMRLAYDTKRKKLFSFGGFSERGALADLRVWEDNDWKTISELPDMKAAEGGFVYDAARDCFVAFGGSSERGKMNDATWEWNGSAWKKYEGKGPEGRQAFAMVYDSKRKRTIIYGGSDGSGKRFTDGIWEFDGKKWENIPGSEPGPRLSPGFAYDSKRGLFILYGGRTGEGASTDTWAWDGKEWKKLSGKGPAARAMGYMAYDKQRDKIVLFGGRLGWPNDAGDTWEWDGSEWREVK